MSQVLDRRYERKQSNLLHLQKAATKGWVKYTLDKKTNIVHFRMKGKVGVDFMLLKNKFININTGEICRSNMKKFLKWYRRNGDVGF